MTTDLTLVFAGTPAFAVPALITTTAWCRSYGARLLVLTQPDRRAGRGQKLSQSPVKDYALSQGLALLQPPTLKSAQTHEELRLLGPTAMIVVAYGLLLPKAVLEIPRQGCFNLHASLLPRWRGAAPIARAIEAGDRVSGVTLMKMSEGLDSGPVLLQRALWIARGESAGHLHDRLAILAGEMLTETLDELLRGKLPERAQDDKFASYAPKLEKEECRLRWDLSAVELERRINALNPWPVATVKKGDEELRIWEAHAPSDDETSILGSSPGLVLRVREQGIDIATVAGILRVTRLQRPGGKVLNAADFTRAYPLLGAKFT